MALKCFYLENSRTRKSRMKNDFFLNERILIFIIISTRLSYWNHIMIDVQNVDFMNAVISCSIPYSSDIT